MNCERRLSRCRPPPKFNDERGHSPATVPLDPSIGRATATDTMQRMDTHDVKKASTARVKITAACEGHGRCYHVAPEIFGSKDDGFGIVELESVGPELREALTKALRLCPTEAIELTEE
jgi:ferredoxin